jgi:hypothetical protein
MMAMHIMSSSPPTLPPPQPPRPPFDPARWAMILLAVLIVVPSLAAGVTAIRCAIWTIPECLDRPWPMIFRDFLSETIPVLVAIVMGQPRQPPRE